MEHGVKRKEVRLGNEVIYKLQQLANKRQWSLKQYMEWVLTKESSKAIGRPGGYTDNMAPMLGEAINNGTRKTKRK
jgi:hypothetical protein